MNKVIAVAVIIILIGVGAYFFFTKFYKNYDSGVNSLPIGGNTENKIIIKNFAFNPTPLTIKAGATVIWTNDDSAPHTIKSDTFNSEILNPGESFQFQFSNAGTFHYICGIHTYMKGEIIVNQ